mmetsp:Transcript_28284/g.87493  ORF Transcript_28284/g.87493 Transcript_28284/m.87493 type:complete len:340 (+) Transcript_28284:1442-2461(+)
MVHARRRVLGPRLPAAHGLRRVGAGPRVAEIRRRVGRARRVARLRDARAPRVHARDGAGAGRGRLCLRARRARGPARNHPAAPRRGDGDGAVVARAHISGPRPLPVQLPAAGPHAVVRVLRRRETAARRGVFLLARAPDQADGALLRAGGLLRTVGKSAPGRRRVPTAVRGDDGRGGVSESRRARRGRRLYYRGAMAAASPRRRGHGGAAALLPRRARALRGQSRQRVVRGARRPPRPRPDSDEYLSGARRGRDGGRVFRAGAREMRARRAANRGAVAQRLPLGAPRLRASVLPLLVPRPREGRARAFGAAAAARVVGAVLRHGVLAGGGVDHAASSIL